MITIERNTLLPALISVIKAVERRVSMPILGHILLEASTDQITLTATNLDLQITVTFPCQNDEAIVAALPASTLHDAVRKLDEQTQIKLSFKEKICEMRANRAKFNFHTLDTKDLPIMNHDDVTTSFKLSTQNLNDIINQVGFAVSTDETRYYLTGINLHAEYDKLVAVATDGHRLAQLKLSDIAGIDSFAAIPSTNTIILPRAFCASIKGLFTGNSDIEVQLSTSRITMQQGNITIISKLIDGTFPEYTRVIPQDPPHLYYLPTNELAKALDRVMSINSERGRAVKFCFGQGQLKLTAIDPDRGEAVDSVDLLADSASEEIEIGFNGRYALDQLAACGCDELIFGLNSSNEPALMKPKTILAGSSVQFVLMPMRF